ncbi:MAG: pre-peptidase C-terminal domain-containing protein [Acidobacteria bacterium]|nr:pre-peptidase C-terminal domain-containing protein [Acidobacteriota bacterium]
MFRFPLFQKLSSHMRAARRVALIVSLFAVAALPYVNAGAWQQQKRVGGKKIGGAVDAGINTRQSEKPSAKAVVKKETGEAQPLAVCTQNQPINFGQTINGRLATGDCLNPIEGDGSRVDEYTFTGSAGQQIAVAMSAAFDTFLYLLNPDGSVLAVNDDANASVSTDSRIPPTGFITLPSSGVYSILANSFRPEDGGPYSLALTAGTTCNLTPIAFGETKAGTLTTGDCTNPIDVDGTPVDYYTFNGTAGQQIAITLTATSGNLDPYLYLLTPAGDLLAKDDNGGGGTAARIPPLAGFGRLPTTGTYTIIVNTLLSSQSGNYNLTLSRAANDCASLPLTLGTPVNGSLANGDCRLLEDSSFLDAYTFTGSANGQVVITMTSSTAGLVPVLFLLGPTGDALDIDNNPDGDNAARLPSGGTASFTLPVTGTYTVLANASAFGQTGTYALMLARSEQQNAHTISGRVTGSGAGLSGITVTLSGSRAPVTATTTTDANGFYTFVEFPADNSYTITPTNTAQYSFTPQTVTSLQNDQTLNFVGIPNIIISEFRFRGPNGATDEFIELYNQTDQAVGITDWALVSGGTVLHTVSSGAIPARGHYLITGATYSLPAASDGALTADIPDSAGIALFNNASNFATGARLDAAGFSTASALYIEGGGLSPASGITTDSEHAFVRKLTSGAPQDTDNNSADFMLVATDPLVVGNNAVLGAPGPENLTSPIQRNAVIKGSLVDPQCSGFGSVASGCARVRTAAGANPTTAQYGTLRIRRKFTNTNPSNVTTLRFRIVGITTLGSPGAGSGQADLRLISSSPADFNVTLTNGSEVPVKGTQVETPPTQPNGGGLNSTVITITTATPIVVGGSINVEFTLGVQQQGAFSFFVNVEALTAPHGAIEATKAGATKRAGSRKEK